MTFKDARCPNCGGELQLPDDKQKVKCMYCGSDIVVQEAVSAVAGPKVENLMGLADSAMRGSNFQEAHGYYNKVLEVQPSNHVAWFNKGVAAGSMSTLYNFRITEMTACIEKAIELTPDDKKQETRAAAALEVSRIAEACYAMSRNHVTKHISVLPSSWQEYIDRFVVILSAMDIAHKYAPDNREIVGNVIILCKVNIEGITYSDETTYPPVIRVARLAEACEAQIKTKMAEYSDMMKKMAQRRVRGTP